jgi:Ca-activated chloride channel family protein
MRPRILLSLLTLLLLILNVSACALGIPATPTPTSIACSNRTNTPVQLTVLYGSEKQEWLQPAIADFNARQIRACDGPITINATPIGSGASMDRILAGDHVDAWLPASSWWLSLLNEKWAQQHPSSRPLVGSNADAAAVLVSSPVVIAMWEPLARLLGWPNKAIGWGDIAALSVDPRGWGAVGRPDLGAFTFAHTNPALSNSGLNALAAIAYAAAGKVNNLSCQDVQRADVQALVRNVESSIIYYGESTGFFADQMLARGPTFLQAAVLYENLIVEANLKPQAGTASLPKLVAIYPKEGTFITDHPFVIPDGDWVTPAKRAAAQVFRAFLLDAPQQQKALALGFRPSPQSHLAIKAPLDSAHGVDPGQPQSGLGIPSAAANSCLLALWGAQRRHVDVMLLFDRSGSMEGAKLTQAKVGLQTFIGLLGPEDDVGFTAFSTTTETISQVSPLGPKRDALRASIDKISAGGQTRLYDSIFEQATALQQGSGKNIRALVVLTDGEETVNIGLWPTLLDRLREAGVGSGTGVKIYTIKYGADARKDVLDQIAQVGGTGSAHEGTPADIQQVYQDISAFFS